MALYSVITGDLVKSRNFIDKRQIALNSLNEIFNSIKKRKNLNIEVWISDIFRGDSFQIVVSDAVYALLIAIYIRAQLIRKSMEGVPFGARISIGIGSIEYLNREKITESDGEAFRLSGRAVDEIPNYRRLIIKSSNEELNKILDVISACIDAITLRWSSEQAEAISYWIFGETQTSLAKIIGVSQSAIQQRLQRAGHFALEVCLKHFNSIIEKYKPQN